MKVPRLLRRSNGDTDGVADVAPAEIVPWTGKVAWQGRAITGILYGGIILGAALIAVLVISTLGIGGGPVDARSKSERASAGVEASIADHARSYVRAWLSATKDDSTELAEFISPPQAASLPATAPGVSDLEASDLQRLEDGVWSVTVSARVRPAGTEAAPVRRYFQAAISLKDEQFAVVGFPAPVPGPQVGAAADTDYSTSLTADDPLWSTTQDFITALVAGGGDISRYLTPGTTIAAIDPAPFAGVELTELGADAVDKQTVANPPEGGRLRILAAARLVDPGDQVLTTQYALTVTSRAGRWEITEIDVAPKLGSPSSTTTPSTEAPSSGEPTEETSPPASSTPGEEETE